MKSMVSAEETLQKTEEWETEKEMLQRFSAQEFQRHLASGMVVWRQDPTTWDCYDYCDTKKFKKIVNVGRKKQWEEGQEYEPTAEEEASYSGLYNQAMGLQGDALASSDSLGQGFDLGKGKGKGKRKELALAKAEAKANEKPMAKERPNWLWKMGKWRAKKKKKQKKQKGNLEKG